MAKKTSQKSVKKENKSVKKIAKVAKEVEKDEGGTSLDDAFGDDEDVIYAESKPRKEKKKTEEEESEEELDVENDIDGELDAIERGVGELSVEQSNYEIKASKPIAQLKKGDKVKVDGIQLEVDSHYVLMDHKTTKEMTLELFDPKNDQDYQLRYFDDQVDSTLEFYELKEIMYIKKVFRKVEW
ncbi:MAG: hypothetical protein AABX66_01120 [Nanoarchaeota archaeon]